MIWAQLAVSLPTRLDGREMSEKLNVPHFPNTAGPIVTGGIEVGLAEVLPRLDVDDGDCGRPAVLVLHAVRPSAQLSRARATCRGVTGTP